MRERFSIITVAIAGTALSVIISASITPAAAQAPYAVTVEDPTVWTRPWTAKQEFTLQNDQENRIYNEPRCIEGNYGLPGSLHGHRMEDLAFAEGRGPDPRTISTVNAGDGERDPLQ